MMIACSRVGRVACTLSLVALAACDAASTDPAIEEHEQAATTAQKLSALSTDARNDSSAPAGFTLVNGKMLFFSLSGQVFGGLGLYRSDGTAAGTQLVRDLDPRVHSFAGAPRIVVLGNRGYWSQDNGLWATDGTAAGTTQLAAFPISTSFDPTTPVAYQGAIYFGALGSLFRSDGTAAGTQVIVSTIRPSGSWQEMAGKLYFGCEIGSAGRELCVTDGTAAGTSLVKEILPGIQSSDPVFLGVVGTRLLFSAVKDAQFFARGLWSTDGTAAGTVELIAPPGASFQDAIDRDARPATVFAGNAYLRCFTASTGFELCRTNGTVAGTSVLDVIPGTGSSSAFNVVALPSRLVFTAFTSATGGELWTSNGTVAGTQPVIDLVPGPESGTRGDLVVFAGAIYFAGKTAFPDPWELWKTDGTAAGTTRVAKLLAPGAIEHRPFALIAPGVLGTKLLFSADDGTTAAEPWITDGTTAGTHLLKDLSPTRTLAEVFESVAYHGARYLAVESDGINHQLWRSDGTAAGTAVFQDVTSADLTVVDHWLYYQAGDSPHHAVWKSDGTAAGTAPLVELGFASELQAFGKRLVFRGETPNQSSGLWQSDGTPAGTALLDPDLVNARNVGVANGRLWLSALYSGFGNELWTSDGTTAGTAPVKDILEGFDSSEPGQFVALDGQTLFVADDGVSGFELWKTDGTAAGTVLVADINPGTAGSDASSLLAWNGMVIFTATSAGQTGLWRTDGTAAGTVLIKALTPGRDFKLVPWGNHVFFAATDAQGTELWRSDGTPGGTVMVRDLYPGPLSSNPSLLVLAGANGPLVFAAEEPLAGREVWKLTQPLGTPQLVANIAPGPQSSRPTSIGVQGSALLVVADNGTGYALWRLTEVGSDATAPVVTCPADVTVTTASQGAAVTFPPPSATDNAGPATVTSDRTSGEVFPIGTTTVNVIATDGSNNTSSCAFAITVVFDPAAPDAGTIDGGAGGGSPDAGPNQPPDARPSPRPDAGNGEVPGDGDDDGGCGCRAGSHGGAANLFGFAVVALVLRRRRRR